MRVVWEALKVAPHNLRISLRSLKQEERGSREFMLCFAEMAWDAHMVASDAK